MKLIGILTWYDEAPSWLAACVSSMIQHAQIDHLVAVDGAYGLVPGGRAFSGFEQHQVIDEVCRATPVGLTMFTPQEPWLGNEVEKRSFAFELAEIITDGEDDWYLVLDADEVVTHSFGIREILEQTEYDLGMVSLFERFDPHVTPGASKIARRVNMP